MINPKQQLRTLFLYLSLLLIPLSSAKAGNPVSVPVNHPIYDYFERMESLGLLTNLLDGIRPYSRARVAELLQVLQKHRAELTAIDRDRLDNWLLDFRFEIDRSKKYHLIPEDKTWYSILSGYESFKKDFFRFFSQPHPEEENHVVAWEEGDNNFYLDYEQDFTYETRSDDVYRLGSWQTYIFRGLIHNNFGMALNISLQGVRGDFEYAKDHPVLKGSWSQQKEDEPRYGDRSMGELAWHTKYIDFYFAQQEVQWGHGESGRLILSNNPEPYPYLSLQKSWGWGKFISLHGKLQSFPQDTLADGYRVFPDKWVAAQRLEFTMWKRLTFGLNECFIYGNRYADWAYLIPFNFYRATQHKLRDRDNATISIDLELLLYRGAKIYGTVFLDEFRRSKIGTDWFGNKHAFHFGAYQADPFGLSNLSLRFEYTAIMPWVYTHKFAINSYTSDYQSIGHWAGPNSEVYYFHLQKDWHHRLRSGFKFQQWKHGANYPNENIGGDILLGHGDLLGTQTEPKQTRQFLEGILTSERNYELYLNYEMFNDFYVMGALRRIQIKEETETKRLNEIFFGMRLSY